MTTAPIAASTTSEPGATITDRLRVGTQPMHVQTENQAFQRDLAGGTLPRGKYVESLGQLLHIHRALDGRLLALRADVPAIGTVMREHYAQEQHLLDDLAFFGRDAAAIEPLQATKQMTDRIEGDAGREPVSLLGTLYVLEGSNNGGKFLAKAVRRAYALPDGRGTRYLDPYGDRQRECWAEFKAAMNAVPFTAAECDAILAAAQRTFEEIGAVYREVYQT